MDYRQRFATSCPRGDLNPTHMLQTSGHTLYSRSQVVIELVT